MPRNKNKNQTEGEDETKSTPAVNDEANATAETIEPSSDDEATCAITFDPLTEAMGPIVLCNATTINRPPAFADSVQELTQWYHSISELSGEAGLEFFKHNEWAPRRDLNNVALDQSAAVLPHPAFNGSSSLAISHYLNAALRKRQQPYPGVTSHQLLEQSQAALDYMNEQDDNQDNMAPVEYKNLSLMLQVCNALIGTIALTLSTSSTESIIPIAQKAYAIAAFNGNCPRDDDDWAVDYDFGDLISTTSHTALFIISALAFVAAMLPSLCGIREPLDSRRWPGAINNIASLVPSVIIPGIAITCLLFYSNVILDLGDTTLSIDYETSLKRNGIWEGNDAKGCIAWQSSYTPDLNGWLNAQKHGCVSNDFTLTATEYNSTVDWATPADIATCNLEAVTTWQEKLNILRFIIGYGFGVVLPAIIGTLFYAFNTEKSPEQRAANRINFFQQRRARNTGLESVRVVELGNDHEIIDPDIDTHGPSQPLLQGQRRTAYS